MGSELKREIRTVALFAFSDFLISFDIVRPHTRGFKTFNGAARTHCAGAEYEVRIPIGRFTRFRSMINHFCCFLDSSSAKNPKPNSAITPNSVNLYNTTGYAYKEEDWNV
jgi:hypothetical protein